VCRCLREDLGAAKRLGREYSEDLHVLDDLGWGSPESGSIELSVPPEVLSSVFGRLRKLAAAQSASEAKERAEAREGEEQNRLLMEACRHVLESLNGEASQ
jgi:hypothetical protein